MVELLTRPNTEKKIDLSNTQGDLRESMGRMFVHRLEKLADELMAKPDCPELFWIIYTVKWDEVNRKIKEMWQVTDEEPKNHMLGQIVYKVNKSGHASFVALPMDIPVPESALSEDIVVANYDVAKKLILSDQIFEKI